MLEIPERLDRAMGDVHPQGNPHVHMDPRNIAKIATALSERMIRLDPGEADKNLKWDGANIWSVLSEGAALKDRTLYWTAPCFRSSALRVGGMKLIIHKGKQGEDDKAELYDLAKDPNEITDLAATMPGKVAELKTKLAETALADRDAVAND